MFTGSGFPMRFADTDGSILDVYQAATQITDETDTEPSYPQARPRIEALLDKALGDEGYYGAFTVNMHTDDTVHAGARAIVGAAQARGVPVISAEQLLDWTDARNGSTFTGLTYADGTLRFGIEQAAGANGLRAMVPAASAAGTLQAITRDGAPVAVAPRTIKGIAYAVFDAQPGAYVATYPGAPGGGGGGGGPAGPPSGPERHPARRTRRHDEALPDAAQAVRAREPQGPRRLRGHVPGERAALRRRLPDRAQGQAARAHAAHGCRRRDAHGEADAVARGAQAAEAQEPAGRHGP